MFFQDGCIDFEEFMVVFCVLDGGQPREVLAKIFRMFDVNGDGQSTAMCLLFYGMSRRFLMLFLKFI